MAVRSNEPIRAVIFDIGGVLFENIQEFFLPDLARRHGLDPDHVLSLGYRHGADWGLGRSTEEDYWRGILADAGLDLGLLPSLVEETTTYIRPIPQTWEVVNGLPPDLRIGILSNTTWEWTRRLREVHDWADRFDPVLLSCELGLCKPDPAIYRLLLERLGLPGAQVLFVDDREDNLAAAAALGIKGHLFVDQAGLQSELARRGIAVEEAGSGARSVTGEGR
jgi:putative hydrolase of the HAD superfamily